MERDSAGSVNAGDRNTITAPVSGNSTFQRAVVHSTFRFFDNDAHFSKPAINTLVHTLQRTQPYLREKFYLSSMACRRRMALKPTNGSMRQIFQIERAADALKHRAHVSFLRRAIAERGLTLYEAFLAVDANRCDVLVVVLSDTLQVL